MKRFFLSVFGLLCVINLVQARSVSVTASESDVSYVFYSRDHFDGIFVHINDSSVNHIKDVFKTDLPTVVLIHGFKDSFEADSNTYVRQAILSKMDANVIKVDWSPLAGQNYLVAKNAVPYVGVFTASFLSSISASFQYSLTNVTLVGFSLGAHIAGNIGRNTDKPVGLIMALDPAGPLITNEVYVKPSDADYVQSIHTNGGLLGTLNAVGHSDFYPNGGSRQPGCGTDAVGGCAHNRAWEYFAESLGDNKFLSQKCDSYDNFSQKDCNGEKRLMGGLLKVDKLASGLYYLDTNDQSPYGQG
ncbi:hypothetical protein GWI33_007629 [Rhynchophorus ferrugineus]|uniref:Lipase domain-containing protein n=1 Tax=Rhynchophorus ferrugineus TaxID=354439 RepID=A0A834MBX6_RHYFE|nr:hypothetical protein GWI33_007629 [Rhynchophorus ferrugineus]